MYAEMISVVYIGLVLCVYAEMISVVYIGLVLCVYAEMIYDVYVIGLAMGVCRVDLCYICRVGYVVGPVIGVCRVDFCSILYVVGLAMGVCRVDLCCVQQACLLEYAAWLPHHSAILPNGTATRKSTAYRKKELLQL